MENYEQKLKEIINSNNTPFADIKILSKYFPELKESEDENERIRKAIIKHFEEITNRNEQSWITLDIPYILAWLEKQGEKTEPIGGFNTEFERQVSHLIASVINKEHEYNQGYVKWTANTLLNYAKHELEKQGEQKSTDKIEPKFKVGDWIVKQYLSYPFVIVDIKNDSYILNDIEGNKYEETIDFAHKVYHLWTIQDAKEGDILISSFNSPFIFKEVVWDEFGKVCCAYGGINGSDKFFVNTHSKSFWTDSDGVKPATNEQNDLLFQKMKEAGYEWDDDKKELKKIEQSCYHNDGLYYAIDILEKTLGKVEGYQSDDGKMEHQIAIETVNALYHKKPTEWREEDEEMFDAIIADIQFTQKAHNHEVNQIVYEREIDWLKVLKDRMKGE